jgi:cathepsin L
MSMLLFFVLLSRSAASLDTFEAWQARFGKEYGSISEIAHARANFDQTVKDIKAHDSLDAGFQLGLNQFADLSDQEYTDFASMDFSGIRLSEDAMPFEDAMPVPQLLEHRDIKSEVDWEKEGKVSPIIEQQKCGACWSIAATGAIEGAYAIATGTLVRLSFQDILTCDAAGSPLGRKTGFACACNGGDPDGAFMWVRDNGLITWDALPFDLQSCDYLNRSVAQCNCGADPAPACPPVAQQTCPGPCVPGNRKPVVKIANYTAPRNYSQLMEAVSMGPAITLIDCSTTEFKNYKGGILDSPTCQTLHNHVVLVVGYGTEGGVDYWKIKNSMGTTWGEEVSQSYICYYYCCHCLPLPPNTSNTQCSCSLALINHPTPRASALSPHSSQPLPPTLLLTVVLHSLTC